MTTLRVSRMAAESREYDDMIHISLDKNEIKVSHTCMYVRHQDPDPISETTDKEVRAL